MDTSEGDLLSAATAGDEEALTRLLARYGPQVRKTIAAKIGNRWSSVLDADDVMQVTYLEAFLRIGYFSTSGTGSFNAWLARIARNNLLDAVKALERSKRPPPEKRVGTSASEDRLKAVRKSEKTRD